MKKILASILVLTMLVCCMSISAFAEGAPARFKAVDASGEPGETITINVEIFENKGISAVEVGLTCDQFTVNDIAQGSWVTTGMLNKNLNKNSCNWVDGNGLKTESGIFAVYTVTIDEDAAPGTYDMYLSSVEIVDDTEDANEFPGETVKATLTVEGEIVPPHVHDFSGAWEKNEADHWKVCPTDNEIGQKAAHVYDDDKDADCNECGYTREVEDDHEHDFSGEWQYDDQNHWKECEEDGQEGTPGPHEYTDDADTTCDVCGYERTIDDGGDDGDDNTGDDNTGDDNTGDDEDGKDEDKDDATQTGDSTNLFIYMAICLFAMAAIVVASFKLKKTRG